MSDPKLEEVFRTNGVPTYTFVEPTEFPRLVLNLRTPGRGLVVEGPSGIGKTTAIEMALRTLGMDTRVTKLSARKREDVEYIRSLPDLGGIGIVIVDEFHKLGDNDKNGIADLMKTLADDEKADTKVIIIGINMAGQRLISLAHDLVNRLDVVRFEANPEHKVRDVVTKGCDALNIGINEAERIVDEAQGSFYIAQMLCSELCVRSGILEHADTRVQIDVSCESVKTQVVRRLSSVFLERCKECGRGSKLRPEGRAPYLHILYWLATGKEWTLSLADALRMHADLRGSVGQVVEKDYLQQLIANSDDLQRVMHYDSAAKQLSVEDPQFVFFIRNIAWNTFAREIGYRSVEFKNRYDCALSFAGADRDIARCLFQKLTEWEVEVFYDENEQHRIAGEDIEEYLFPIYQSEAKFVIPLLSRSYPTRVWTRVEAQAFKSRVRDGAVIPVRFCDVPPSHFDPASAIGGLAYDPNNPTEPQIDTIVSVLRNKMSEVQSSGEPLFQNGSRG